MIAFLSATFTSCETDSATNAPSAAEDAARMAPTAGKQLRIINNTDMSIEGEIYCYGAVNNMTANSNIRIMGRTNIPAGIDVTFKNFAQSSNPELAVNTWYVSTNNSSPIALSAQTTNQFYGQLFTPGFSTSKFANFRYLKVRMKLSNIVGFEPVTMFVELPQYSSNNSGERVVNLSPFGLSQNLHISQSSFVNSVGNTILTFDSALVNQIQ